jgi:NTP pyrophosphatase (non-canonical NTP hydrolase)
MKHFNGLSPSEAERLALLLEECGEVQQIIGKILRHGYESYHPEDETKTSNRALLEKEIADVSAAVNLMIKTGDVKTEAINRMTAEKLEKVGKYLHHHGGIK